MADFKGIIKFIGENKDFAIVQEVTMIENNIITSTGIGVGDASNRHFTGSLTPVVEEGELVIKVDGVAITAVDADGIVSGADISTSTGEEGSIDYESGALDFYTTVAATPGGSEIVAVEYEYSLASVFPKGLKLVKGDFSSRSVGDSIYYDYDADDSLKDGYFVTENYTS